jgi:hypothetical protein
MRSVERVSPSRSAWSFTSGRTFSGRCKKTPVFGRRQICEAAQPRTRDLPAVGEAGCAVSS